MENKKISKKLFLVILVSFSLFILITGCKEQEEPGEPMPGPEPEPEPPPGPGPIPPEPGPIPPEPIPPPTHFECINEHCVKVSGSGPNQCTNDDQCKIPTHNECKDGSCIEVKGAGHDQCTSDSDCVVQPPEEKYICTDSDGGKDYYVKGEITGELVAGSGSPSADMCLDGSWLRELFCNNEAKGEPIGYECPYGCEDGACVEEPTETMTINGNYIILNENFPDDVYSSPIAFYTGVLPVGKIVRTLINFDLSGLEGKEIRKAEFVINKISMLYEQEYGKQLVGVHKVTGPWDTTTACWNNQPGFDTTVISSKEITENGKYTFSVTPTIMDYLIKHEAGLLLKAEDESKTSLKKFDGAYLNIWYTAEEEETKSCKEMGGNCRFLFGCRSSETEADYKCPFWSKCCMPNEPEVTENCEELGGNCRFLIGCRDEEIYTADYKCPFWGKCCMPPEEPEQLEGTILVKKDSIINQFAKELASEKNWNLLEVSTSDPKTIRDNIIQLYNKEPFNFLLILGDETHIPIYDKELLRDYVISTGFESNGKIMEKDENVLDSLYYGNLDDDLYIELAVGRLPFTNVNDLEGYYSNLPSKKSINKINVLSHLSMGIPAIGYLRPQLASYQETEYFMINTISEFNQHLISSDLLYSNNHGSSNSFAIGEFYTLEHIPNLDNKQIIVGESCSAGAELGPEFVKKGAIAYIGYYIPAKLGGLVLLDQPSNFKTIGEVLKETNNFYYMRQLTNPGPRSIYYLIGDPSIEIEFDSHDKINIETKNNQLGVKVPAMDEYTFNLAGDKEVTNIYSQYTYQFSSTSSTLNLLKENPPYETDNEILIKCDPQYETGFLLPCRNVSSEYPNSPYQYAAILMKTDQGYKDTYPRFVIRLDKNYNVGKLYESKEGQIEELDDYLIEVINAEGGYYLIIYEPNTIMFNNINNGDAYKERTFIVDIT